MPQKIPDSVTPITPLAVYAALRLASASLPDGQLGHRSVLLLCAHVGLETGWHAAHGWNIGNFKHTPNDGHDWATFMTTEYVNGVKETLPQDFRAYSSLDEGVADYLRELQRTFGYAWPAIEAGDAVDFAHRLKVRGYYTAPEADYAAGVSRVMADLERQIPDPEPARPSTPIAIARAQPDPGQPTPPGDLPDPPDEPA